MLPLTPTPTTVEDGVHMFQDSYKVSSAGTRVPWILKASSSLAAWEGGEEGREREVKEGGEEGMRGIRCKHR